MNRAGLSIVLALAVGACGHDAPPAPGTDLPPLQRPLFALTSAAGERPQIPRTALVTRGGVPGVYVMEQGQARFRMVRPGPQQDGMIEISAGLLGDEQLVVGDLAAVHDGTPVQPTQP
jgi:hypothetical protein